MDEQEYLPQSFIVKIWPDDAGIGREGGAWRGYIVHVPSNERLYLRNLEDILAFIAPYLRPESGPESQRS
jgi:hypothetical protein